MYFVAFGCSNSSVKGKRKEGISFRTFPFKKPALLKAWISKINRKDWPPSSGSRLCSEHFTAESFEEDIGLKLLGGEFKRKKQVLKEDAVPTILLTQQEEQTSGSGGVSSSDLTTPTVT